MVLVLPAANTFPYLAAEIPNCCVSRPEEQWQNQHYDCDTKPRIEMVLRRPEEQQPNQHHNCHMQPKIESILRLRTASMRRRRFLAFG